MEEDSAEELFIDQIVSFAVDGPLTVVDSDAAIYVVQEDDRDDWLVRFDKDGQFPAAEWAHHMVAVYNDRLLNGDNGRRYQARPPGMHLDG